MRKDTRLAGLQAALRVVVKTEREGIADPMGWVMADLRQLIRAERKPKKGAAR